MWGLLRDRVTLSDIAQRAGVAASTVSRVLSGAKPVATGTRGLDAWQTQHSALPSCAH
jgi:transcriptional regulator with XRE-family HTH domain